jgi:hypothetical protein
MRIQESKGGQNFQGDGVVLSIETTILEFACLSGGLGPLGPTGAPEQGHQLCYSFAQSNASDGEDVLL